MMKRLAQTALLATATVAMAAVPAAARDHRRGHDGIDAGDVIAGALVIGGIAAIASAASDGNRYRGDRYDRYDRNYGYNDYGRGGDSRSAVDRCVRAVQSQASRYGWARVTDVTRIDRTRGGYEVRGRLVVENDRYRGNWRGGRDRYGYNYNRYGNDYDKGKFSCLVRYGDVQDIRLSGLRGGH